MTRITFVIDLQSIAIRATWVIAKGICLALRICASRAQMRKSDTVMP